MIIDRMKRKTRISAIRIAAILTVCAALTSEGAAFSFKVEDGFGKKLRAKDGTLYGAPCVHVTVAGTARIKKYSYQYQKHSPAPNLPADKMTTLPKRPFFKDIFFFRKPKNQWIILTVEALDGTVKSFRFGVKGGKLTAPPDKPLTGIEYAKGMMNGHVNQGVENWVRDTPETELEEKDVLKWKKLGFNSLRINMAPSLAGLESPQKKFANKTWNELLDKYVELLLRHGTYVFFSRFGHWAKDKKYMPKVKKGKLSGDLRGAMAPVLQESIPWWTALAKYWRFHSHRLAYETFVEAKKKTFACYSNMLNHYYAGITQPIRKVDPERVIIYTAPRHSFDCLQGLLIPKEAKPYCLAQAHKGFLGSASKLSTLKDKLRMANLATTWANANGVPVLMGAGTTWAGDGESIPELCRYLKIICSKFNDNKVPCPMTWWANEEPMVAQAEQNYRFVIDPDDTDSDGLSNAKEKQLGTNPNSIDTDNDNILDKDEVDHGLNPRLPDDGYVKGVPSINGDLDGDGIGNFYELEIKRRFSKDGKPVTGFDLEKPDGNLDHDKDGLSNLWEVVLGLKPFASFTQSHSAGSWKRIAAMGKDKYKVNDANRDDDGDGMSNIDEVKAGRWPMDKKDTDKDGLRNGTDPIPYVSDKAHVIFYPFEGNTANYGPAGGAELDGKPLGKTAFAKDAPRGKALALNGKNAGVAFPASQSANPARIEGRSVSLRFKPLAVDGIKTLFTQGDAKSGMSIYIDKGILYGGIWCPEKPKGAFARIGIAKTGKWAHVALVVDTKRGKLLGYLDGKLTADAKLPSGFAKWGIPNGKGNAIGCSPMETVSKRGKTPPGAYFNGAIDEVNVYNRALSGVDVSRLNLKNLPLVIDSKTKNARIGK
jgi:hypothetical protein